MSLRSTNLRSHRILLVVHMSTFLTEMAQLAKLLKNDPRFDPKVMLYSYAQASRDARYLAAFGIPCCDANGQPFAFDAPRSKTRLGRIANALVRRLPPLDFLAELLSLHKRSRTAIKILRDLGSDLVVLGGDMVGLDSASLIRSAKAEGIAVAIVPSTMSNGLEQAEVYSGDARHGMTSALNKYVAKRYPKWIITHKGKKILRERGARALAYEWLDLTPDLPWIFNSGAADAITVESDAMKEYYVEAGLPDNQLVVTGSPSDDAMASVVFDVAKKKIELCRELDLPIDQPVLLSALPPDFLYVTGGRPQCDFTSYADLVAFWMGTIEKAPDVAKIICLHPSVDPETMRHLERTDMKIATLPTAQLIPLCDMYISSVSSTIRWAIACGKPVINYDVYRYRYTDYVGLKGVLTIEEQSEYVDLVQRMSSDASFRASIAALQQLDAPRYGNLDGKAGERLLALIESMITGRSQLANGPDDRSRM